MLRLLFFIAAVLLSASFAQDVKQVQPSLDDLMRLLGDVTVLELEVPQEATVLREAFTSPNGLVKGATLLGDATDAAGRRTVRILILAPGISATAAPCEGEVIDVHVVMPGGSSGSGPHCLPRPAGVTYSQHQLVLSGQASLDDWTPLYIRSWTAVEEEEAGSGTHLDLANAFTLQIQFTTGTIETMNREPPLDAEALIEIPGIAERLGAPVSEEQ